jgi:hypothetical protein
MSYMLIISNDLLICMMESENKINQDGPRFADPVSALVLRITGVILIVTAASFMLTPVFVIERAVGFPSLINPLFMYLLRTAGVTYLWIGVSFLVASKDPGRYRLWIRASAYMLIVLGVVCAISGFLYSMPVVLYIVDGILCVTGSVVLFWISPAFK